jgi:hypothetical protein
VSDQPLPENCTARVRDNHGYITTESCTTKRPLIDKGGCSTGCCDYYECPDCGKHIKVCYEE